MKTKNLLLLCFILLCFGACEKDTPPKTAPPITQENTFSCKINGELFVPEDHYHGFNLSLGIKANTLPDNSWRFVLANKRRDIYIHIYSATSTGEYTITASEGYNPAFVGKTENLVEMRDSYVPGADYVSVNNDEKITVLELELDTKIILQFDEITLINNTNPEDVLILSEGKLNINRENLNQ